MEDWEMRELEMDALREESSRWDQTQEELAIRELMERGLSESEAEEQVWRLNQVYLNQTNQEIVALINPEKAEKYDNLLHKWVKKTEWATWRMIKDLENEGKTYQEIWDWINKNRPTKEEDLWGWAYPEETEEI